MNHIPRPPAPQSCFVKMVPPALCTSCMHVKVVFPCFYDVDALIHAQNRNMFGLIVSRSAASPQTLCLGRRLLWHSLKPHMTPPADPQTPLANPQTPLADPQSLLTDLKTPLADHQDPSDLYGLLDTPSGRPPDLLGRH